MNLNLPLFFRREVDKLLRVHWRDLKTGRFIAKPNVFRLSTTINFVVHGTYFGAIIQTWHYGYPDDDTIKDQEVDLIRKVERFVGAPQEEWWFPVRIGQAVQEVEKWHRRWEKIEKKLIWEV